LTEFAPDSDPSAESEIETAIDPAPGNWCRDASGLSLILPLSDGKPHRLHVDFLTGPMGYRLRHSGRSQAIAKAIGLKQGRALPTVWDLTAGLGRDSFVLAWLGCQVTAIERDPRIHALLVDGLSRAEADPDVAAGLAQRLQLVQADAIPWLQHHAAGPSPNTAPSLGGANAVVDVIYLDPMHPERRKSAQVRKEMRMFRELVGSDPDAGQLFAAALAAAPTVGASRIVVKRPRNSDRLEFDAAEAGGPAAPQPNHQFQGKTTRFDIYLTN
jgi:16S rRNA (guanine1516-N2)-methyltransferase